MHASKNDSLLSFLPQDISGGIRKYVLAHSILMAVAFAVLIPVGVMVARHRLDESVKLHQLVHMYVRMEFI